MQTHRHSATPLAMARPVLSVLTAGLLSVSAAAENARTDPPPLAFAAAAMSVPSVLQNRTTVIGRITIDNDDIFDLENPDENKALYRLANRAHITTRPQVIEQQLLFKPGETFDPQAIEESERILRANRYLQTASITSVPRDDGMVDVDVRTTDTWTLMPKLALSRSGGKNNSALGVKEMNLLGSGIAVEAMYRSDVDRDYRTLKFSDRNLGSSWYSLTGIFENNSDGYTRSLAIQRPFFSLQSTSALGFSFFDNDEINRYYDRGDIVGDFRHQARHYEVFGGWSRGLQNGWARRYTVGIVVDDHRFSTLDDTNYPDTLLPADRGFAYPFVGVEFTQDRFEKSSNHEQINRTEDIFLGTRMSARLGLSGNTSRSNGNTWLVTASAQTGFGSVDTTALLLESTLRTRLEPDGLKDFLWSASGRLYRRQSEKRLLYASLNVDFGENLDLDRYLELGGDSGLRGYPLRYQSGDKRALLTVEQRYFTDWYPWRLFHIGGAVFVDIGRAWGDSAAGRADNGLLKNVGAGLRIGNSRSGLGRMTHIDVAVPLDGGSDIESLQFLVSTKKSF